jgi:hypothetical protein
VPKADIVAQGYDLSLNRYKEVVHEDVEHRDPLTSSPTSKPSKSKSNRAWPT